MAKKLNLITSSWPGAGGTTTALILAGLLELKYIYAGGVLKEWAKRMGYDPSSNRFHEWEEKYGDAWDMIWEAYIKAKLEAETNFLYEGKTAGFLLPKDIGYKIMFTATAEERAKRASTDNRTETIIARDKLLQARWKEEFGFDLFAAQDIDKYYNLRIDNSHLTILETTLAALESIKIFCRQNKIEIPEKFDKDHVAQVEKTYWELNKKDGSGKQYLQNILSQQNLLVDNDVIFADFENKVPELISQLPSEMAEVINKNGVST